MTECSTRAYQEADVSATDFEPSAKEAASQVKIEVGISKKPRTLDLKRARFKK